MALHVIVYHCIVCDGPVVAVRLGEAGQVGGEAGHLDQVGDAICMRCRRVQNDVHGDVVQFPPEPWEE